MVNVTTPMLSTAPPNSECTVTPGMSAMKIKVVRDADGGPITPGAAILRIIGLWIGLSVFWIGVIWIFIDKRRRGWQDLIGGTVVVDVPPTVYTS